MSKQNSPRNPSFPDILTRPLTKSRFKTAHECPTKLYYEAKKEEYGNDKNENPFLRNLARGGFQVGALAKLYFPGGVEIEMLDYQEALRQTDELLKRENVIIYEGAFRYENLFVRADIIEKVDNRVHLFEVKSKAYHPEKTNFWQARKEDHLATAWVPYLYDVAFQHHVIQNSYSNLVVVPYLLLPNQEALTTVDGLNQRFKLVQRNGRDSVVYDKGLSQKELGEKILIAIQVEKEVFNIQAGTANGEDAPDWPKGYTFESWVNYLADQHLNQKKIDAPLSSTCKACQFRIDKEEHPGKKSGFEECWTKALTLSQEELNRRIPLFEIWNLQSQDLIDAGVHFVDQITEDDLVSGADKKRKEKGEQEPGLSASDRRVLQWQKLISSDKTAFFDKEGFQKELSTFTYPLHMIDFETSMVAIPFNKGRRAFEDVAFQFSHHVIHKDGKVVHQGQWICQERGKFPNFDFVRALKKELEKDSGTVFRYASHENTILCHIRKQLLDISKSEVPDKDELIAWIQTIAKPTGGEKNPWKPNREMVDLLELVKSYFWHPRMRGSNSIKQVLPAILEASPFLAEKYGKPIYGSEAGIPSLNYKNKQWFELDENKKPKDPYQLLDKVFKELDRNELDRLYGDEELADGGAAMMAYAKMQFSEMTEEEYQELTQCLLRYCELDTLAMVMLLEGWIHWKG